MEGDFLRDGRVPLAGRAADASTARREYRGHRWRWALCASILGIFGVALLAVRPPSQRVPLTSAVGLVAATGGLAQRSFKFLQVNEARSIMEKGLSDRYHRYQVLDELAQKFADVANAAVLGIRGALVAGGGCGFSEADVPILGPTWTPQTDPTEVAKWTTEQHQNVLRLSITGGVCGGKTSCKKAVERELEEKSRDQLVVVTVPEVATLLFNLGAMSYGTFSSKCESEYLYYVAYSVVLQLAFEELYAQAAEDLLRHHPRAKRIVMLSDRDAIDAKAYTLPLLGSQEVEWSIVMKKVGALLGQANLTQADLVRRYQLGTVVLQTYAIVAGRLNRDGYDRECLGPTGSNPMRRESVEKAVENDEHINAAYSEAYPADKLCRVTNRALNNRDEKVHDVIQCVWRSLDAALGYSIRTSP